MSCKSGRKFFSLNYLFASFFGAAMIAGAYGYYSFKFSQFRFLDFQEHVFYEKKDLFEPKDEIYTVLIFSSNMSNLEELIKKIDTKNKILAIDFYQKRFDSADSNIIYVTSGINNLISFIQKFNIYVVPSVFEIKKEKKSLYKQYSQIEAID